MAFPFQSTRQASMLYGARHELKQKRRGAYRLSGRPTLAAGRPARIVLNRVTQQVVVRQKLQRYAFAQRKVAVGRRIGSRHRDIDRVI